MNINEALIKSAQTAALLESDIREAHKMATYNRWIMEIILRQKLLAAVELRRQLEEIIAAIDA